MSKFCANKAYDRRQKLSRKGAETQRVRKENMYRLDIWVERKVIIDVKAVEQIPPVYFRQVRSYLQLTGSKLGLLLNFNVPVLKDGIHRIVLGLEE